MVPIIYRRVPVAHARKADIRSGTRENFSELHVSGPDTDCLAEREGFYLVAKRFFQEVLKQARERNLLSDEHFTVDGTLIEAWASLKSFQRKEQEERRMGMKRRIVAMRM